MNAFAGIWNAGLVIVAALDLAYGNGHLAGAIIGSMVVTALLAGMAASVAESIVEALPFLTGSVGTISMVVYWFFRVDIWIHKLAGGA
jgi:hypothetical protein